MDKVSVFPEVTSIVNNVISSVGNTSLGEVEHTLHGKPFIMETLRGLVFQISASSFFQTNTHQAEVLYRLIQECANLRGDGSEIVLDLVKHVYGYEVVAQATADARVNVKLNGIHNATFIQGDLNKVDENSGNNF
ncbi:hypothetical protein MLD38_021663 [Melastoma candidum]|uniref:Uncharacterized protein n=1 Tax=Melastoma candidum TaxID=119954 RepID=A0ACB9QGM0_9MYRT|nr:hypothetical protein MLD38_021663 [Melastoma candidum]